MFGPDEEGGGRGALFFAAAPRAQCGRVLPPSSRTATPFATCDVVKIQNSTCHENEMQTQHAQSAMRSAIGELELDEILHNRAGLNTLIKGSLQDAAVAWGLEVRRYELTEITPDDQIRVAMDKQAAAERDRREQVLRAEGDKRRAELTSEGIKVSLKNESEGKLIQVTNEAEAEKLRIVREAEGTAEATRVRAEAQAEAIAAIAGRLNEEGGREAAALALARDYVKMYGEMGSKSNTMFFQEGAGNAQSLVVQALASMKAMNMGDPGDVAKALEVGDVENVATKGKSREEERE